MKNYKLNSEVDGFHSVLKSVFGYAKPLNETDDLFETSHGKVSIVSVKDATKEQKEATKPFPGEVMIERKKYLLLYAE